MPTPPLSPELAAQAAEAVDTYGSQVAAAQALGIARGTLQNRLRHHERSQNPGIRDALESVGITDSARVRGGWLKTKEASIRFDMPAVEDDTLDRIRAAFEGIQPAAPVAAPQAVLDDLCTVYCLADMHIGQLSWGRETGEDYDTKIAVARLRDWVGRLVASAPASKEAVILDVGDTTHSDDQTNQTPQSKHVLDVDSRYFRTIEATVAALADAVDLTLAKHEKVTVVILAGNHSPHSYIAILFALAERYRLNPRVEVRREPGFFWAYRFGRNMLAATHGDKTTPQRAVMFLADEYPEMWGATRHRFLWTGHLHSAKMQDIGGVKHEQLRAMTSRDAYAYSHAYVSRSQLQAVTLHAESGELQRAYVGVS